MHPALLDHATGFSAFAVLADEHERRRVVTDRDFFLPVGYDSLRILGAIPARGFSLIRPHADHRPGSEIRKVDVVICDDAGRPAVEVRGFTTKRVTDAKATVARLRPHARHHTLRWVPLPAPTGAPDAPAVPESVLLVAEPGGPGVELAEAIRARGIEVTHAELGARWSPVDEPGRCIVPPTAEGFGRLLDTLGGRRPAEVVHVAAPVGPGPIDPMALEHRLGHGVHSLFHLIRALSERDAVPGRFSVVAPEVARVTGHERSTAAVHATLFGLAKVIGMEHDGTDVLCVDVSDDTAVEEICAELFGVRTPTVTALRGGTRYAAQLTPVRLQDEVRAAPLPEDGVHLVTGGLGGLGLAVARHLAETVPGVRLALVGRSELPRAGCGSRSRRRTPGSGGNWSCCAS
ncbi:polyketide synthase dehydratase domain-containing protein [Streptomyces sp. GD-15H]|uniref:polyketide synthase dehydratase domain-containing protein n=1 Tax=Streptomyces sp. GD-15H TaxID=3129112 RepID=UPI00324B92A3